MAAAHHLSKRTIKKDRPPENNPGFVKVTDCIETHGHVEVQMKEFGGKLDQVMNTLIGTPEPGSLERKNGMMQELKEIRANMKGKWSAKEKAAVLTTFMMAAAAIIAAILK